jgi:predicted transcriptional regulator
MMEVYLMSQTLLVELSDEVYAVIQQRAVEANTSPALVAAISLEEHFRREPRAVRTILIQAGLAAAQSEPLTDDQRKVLAQQVVSGRPLSDYIYEERGER